MSEKSAWETYFPSFTSSELRGPSSSDAGTEMRYWELFMAVGVMRTLGAESRSQVPQVALQRPDQVVARRDEGH